MSYSNQGWYRVTGGDCRSRILHATCSASILETIVFYDELKLTKLIKKTKNDIRGVPILHRVELAVYSKENVL